MFVHTDLVAVVVADYGQYLHVVGQSVLYTGQSAQPLLAKFLHMFGTIRHGLGVYDWGLSASYVQPRQTEEIVKL